MELEQYQLVLLRRPGDAPEFSDAELDDLQTRHLAYLAELRDGGQIAFNGPVVDQPDPLLRGICVYRVGSPAEAKALADCDPMVRAGHLEVVAMNFWTQPGVISTRGVLISPDD